MASVAWRGERRIQAWDTALPLWSASLCPAGERAPGVWVGRAGAQTWLRLRAPWSWWGVAVGLLPEAQAPLATSWVPVRVGPGWWLSPSSGHGQRQAGRGRALVSQPGHYRLLNLGIGYARLTSPRISFFLPVTWTLGAGVTLLSPPWTWGWV